MPYSRNSCILDRDNMADNDWRVVRGCLLILTLSTQADAKLVKITQLLCCKNRKKGQQCAMRMRKGIIKNKGIMHKRKVILSEVLILVIEQKKIIKKI